MKTRFIIPLLLLLCCTAGCSGVPGDHSIEQATPAASANGHTDQTTPSELDIFADAVLNPNLYDDAYPASLTVQITSGNKYVGIDSTIQAATPEHITINAAAAQDRAANYLTKNNYVLAKASESFEIASDEVKHYLLSENDLTAPIIETMQAHMIAEIGVSSLSPEVMYAVLPSPDTDYLASNSSGLPGTIRIQTSDYEQYRLYVIFHDEGSTYYVSYANPVFQNDGTLIHVDEQSVTYTSYGHLENEEGISFTSQEEAYAAIEKTYQPYTDTMRLKPIS